MAYPVWVPRKRTGVEVSRRNCFLGDITSSFNISKNFLSYWLTQTFTALQKWIDKTLWSPKDLLPSLSWNFTEYYVLFQWLHWRYGSFALLLLTCFEVYPSFCDHKGWYMVLLYEVAVAERLRRWTRNPLVSPHVGLSPTSNDSSFF